MRARYAALVVCLSCVSSSWARSSMEAGAFEPVREEVATDESEPANGTGATPQSVEMDICYAAAGSFEARRDFCNSAWVEPTLKQSCWAHVLESRVKWIGWCSWYF